jgi:hypothetical protein
MAEDTIDPSDDYYRWKPEHVPVRMLAVDREAAAPMTENPLMAALRQFEATEANLLKLERLWDEIHALIPLGIVFGDNPQYEKRCRAFEEVLAALPLIDGWKPSISLFDLNGLAQDRFDAKDLGMAEAEIAVETAIAAPGREIREYRFHFNRKRRALIRDSLLERIDSIDSALREVRGSIGEMLSFEKITGPHWDAFTESIAQIDVLLGSDPRPYRWPELRRHAWYGQLQDLNDIEKHDWPAIKATLMKDLYADDEPLPVSVPDLGDLVAAKPRGNVIAGLQWTNLNDETFERLIFNLISATKGYENPGWLTKTNAPDRGRDLSVTRVTIDELSGTSRQRVIIQARHWLRKSVGLQDVITVKEQMALWGEPRVEVVIIATSGRFTTDAIQWIEKHNTNGEVPRIEMWPDSHLELLLASRPGMVAEFGLRGR